MPAKKYKMKLTDEERDYLLNLTSKGKIGARTMKRAPILLKADEGLKDADIISVRGVKQNWMDELKRS